jgi:hypothetical protein
MLKMFIIICLHLFNLLYNTGKLVQLMVQIYYILIVNINVTSYEYQMLFISIDFV